MTTEKNDCEHICFMKFYGDKKWCKWNSKACICYTEVTQEHPCEGHETIKGHELRNVIRQCHQEGLQDEQLRKSVHLHINLNILHLPFCLNMLGHASNFNSPLH